MVRIIEMLIPKSNKKTRPGIKRVPRSITIHETDNEGIGANALAHAKLQYNGNIRLASWHLQVDDEPEVYLSIPYDEVAYAAGDGKGPGNMYSIHIEVCVNRDGNYFKTVNHTVEVVRYLLNKFPSITEVVQHHKWNGKNCPRYLRSGTKGISWQQFLQKVAKGNGGSDTPQVPPKDKTPNHLFKIGEKVRIKKSATYYATGEGIPAYIKGRTDIVLQKSANRVLLKGINSWVKTEDLEVVRAAAALAIDGYMGPATIKALQRYFGTPIDGVISRPSLLIKAMQKWLGTQQDGIISEPYSTMVAALQRRYQTPVDGKISRPSLVVKELQRRLNRGKL